MINKMCMSVVKLLKGKARYINENYAKVEIKDGWVTTTDGYRLISVELPHDATLDDPSICLDVLSARKMLRSGESFVLYTSIPRAQTESGDSYLLASADPYKCSFREPLRRANLPEVKTMKFNTRYLRELLSIIEQNAIASVRIGFADNMIILQTEDETTKQQIQAVLMAQRG